MNKTFNGLSETDTKLIYLWSITHSLDEVIKVSQLSSAKSRFDDLCLKGYLGIDPDTNMWVLLHPAEIALEEYSIFKSQQKMTLKRENLRFWLPLIISNLIAFLSLIISIFALLK